MPRTALIIAVPEAEPVVGEWRERYDNARLGVPAHVTLLFPFVPREQAGDALVAELRELFASQRARFPSPASSASPTSPGWRQTRPSRSARQLGRCGGL